jgi:4-alpha-glucanotransferase
VQWKELRAYCGPRSIQLIGDIPLFVAHHSADAWAHSPLFKLDADGNPTVVAGVPPDYFSKTGQLWGLPVYRWDTLHEEHYRWWIERLRTAFGRFDVNRLDHFIGFLRTYEVSAKATTALNGQYQPGGGDSLFKAIFNALGSPYFIADDLGDTTQEVVALLNEFQIPGTCVLQFDFGSVLEAGSVPSPFHPRRSVVYTGTHDNDTSAGWYGKLTSTQREALRKRLGVDDDKVVWAMVREALQQLGSEARMNYPGIAEGNWSWRLKDGALNDGLADRLRSVTKECERLEPGDPSLHSWSQNAELRALIAKRAYELYEQRGRQSGRSDQDWLNAEREIMLPPQS